MLGSSPCDVRLHDDAGTAPTFIDDRHAGLRRNRRASGTRKAPPLHTPACVEALDGTGSGSRGLYLMSHIPSGLFLERGLRPSQRLEPWSDAGQTTARSAPTGRFCARRRIMLATELQDQVVRELRFDQQIDASQIGVAATDRREA